MVGRTNAGARGGQNQDAMGWDETRLLALVADGMGGYASGEVASAVVKQAILSATEPIDLDAAIRRAHRTILEAVESHPEYGGMGSTVVAMRIENRRCQVAWVGDSRGYLWRGGALRPLTRDHSVAEILREAEDLSETQLRVHPLRSKLVQSLGIDDPVPSLGETPLRHGDLILLCSDGLSSELRDEEIGTVLAAHATLEGTADALIEAALAKGGHDNVTVVLVDYTGTGRFDLSGLRTERAMIWLSAVSGALLATAVAAIVWLVKFRK
jgi:protein phosphatase